MAGYLGALPGLVGFNKRVRNCDVPFPGARRLVASAFGLPTHTLLSERNVRALEQWIGGRDG